MVKKAVKQKRRQSVDLICILTGEVLPKQPYARVDKQAKKLKFENTKEYIDYYISKDARKLLAKGITELEIRKQFKCKETKDISFDTLKHYVKSFRSKDAVDRRRNRKIAEEFKDKSLLFDFKGPDKINMVKNKEVCAHVTKHACWRPDIYLDVGCSVCILKENCACPIKNLKLKKYVKRTKKVKSLR